MTNRIAVSGRYQLNFQPTMLSGCVLWLAADAGVTTSGSAVTAWADQSGSGKSVTQATGANRPTFRSSGIYGRPTIQFDGNDSLSGDGFTGLPTASASATTFTVFNPSYSTGVNFLWCINPTNGDSNHLGLTLRDDTPLLKPYIEAYPASGFSTVNGTNYVFSYKFASGSVSTRLNGVAGTTTNGLTPSATGTPQQVVVGALGGTTFYYTGSIAEIIVFASALSAAEIERVEQYLRVKYGVL